MKKKKESPLKNNYKKSWVFLKESQWYVVAALIIFFASFLVGFIFPIFFENQIFEIIEEMRHLLDGLNVYETITYIFFNNTRASLIAIFSGIFIGIIPAVFCIFNGYLAGFVSRYVVEAQGIFVLWRLLPHGIFEIPAIVLSVGFGLKIGVDIFGRNPAQKTIHNLKESARFFGLFILPLLVIAAIVEGILIFVTA